MLSNEAISINALTKTFRTRPKPATQLKNLALGRPNFTQEFHALKDVNFSIGKGECVGILGPNGSGKSTLLRIISGTMAPTSGSASIQGHVAGILELGAGFLPDLTGRENAILNARVNGYTKSEALSRMDWIESFAEIGDFIDKPIRTYSSGMFVRLAFAVAAAAKPEILVIDEALAVGDIAFQQKCHSHMRIQMDGATRLFVSHDVSRVSTLCDRCIVLHRGEVVFDGNTDLAIVEYLKLSHERSTYSNAGKMTLSGPREVDITNVTVTVDGAAHGNVAPGQMVEAEVEFDSKLTQATSAVFGTSWADETGLALLSTNTEDQGIELRIEPGKSKVRFAVKWPHTRPGRYKLTVGVGTTPFFGGPQRLQCWAHNVFEITCLNSISSHGLIALEMKEF